MAEPTPTRSAGLPECSVRIAFGVGLHWGDAEILENRTSRAIFVSSCPCLARGSPWLLLLHMTRYYHLDEGADSRINRERLSFRFGRGQRYALKGPLRTATESIRDSALSADSGNSRCPVSSVADRSGRVLSSACERVRSAPRMVRKWPPRLRRVRPLRPHRQAARLRRLPSILRPLRP